MGGAYGASVPDRLADLRLTVEGDVSADVSTRSEPSPDWISAPELLTNTKGLARLLQRAESVASFAN